MSTYLFDQVIFGPVKSRRLGVSLGINLLPLDAKVCNYNCIYCECGWNPNERKHSIQFHPRLLVGDCLRKKLLEMIQLNQLPNVITFAGNGEPTMHPEFYEIIEDTIQIRNELCPEAKIAVLSNASLLTHGRVFEALNLVDLRILKLDSAIETSMQIINKPVKKISVSEICTNLMQFNGQFTLQTLFLKGIYEQKVIDNTTEIEVDAWLELVKQCKPKEIMIYTIDRATPLKSLEKIKPEILDEIALKAHSLGFKTHVSY